MTPPNVKRHLVCPSSTCGHHSWEIEVGSSERCPRCGALGQPICACGCGASLSEMRADAVYRSEACAKRLQRNGRPDTDPTRQPLREVRGGQEEGGASADHLILAREQITRTLLATGFFTADDLEPLGIPEQYRRSVHGSATGYFSGEKLFMEEASRRKSERPERKGAKNTVFRITVKGRRELPGLLKGMAGPVAEAHKRLYGQTLVGSSAGASHGGTKGSAPALLDASATSGEKDSSAGSTHPSRELPVEESAARLFEPEPERPRSAFTDLEAA